MFELQKIRWLGKYHPVVNIVNILWLKCCALNFKIFENDLKARVKGTDVEALPNNKKTTFSLSLSLPLELSMENVLENGGNPLKRKKKKKNLKLRNYRDNDFLDVY